MAPHRAGVVYDMNPPSSQYAVPDTNLPPVLNANNANDVISVGSDLWFTDPTDGVGQIGKFDPVTQTNTEYPVPPMTKPPQNQYPNQLTEDSNGNIWFTETSLNLIGEINPSTGAISQSFLTANSSSPVGIVWDPAPQEEQFWMTEPSKNQIVSFNPATSGSAVAPITLQDPVDILVDPAKGYLWISEGSADKIVEYDPINEQILYTFSTKGSPNQLIWGPDGNIWFTESGYVGVLVPPTGPGTGSIKAEIPVSGAGNYLSVGPSSGTYASTIWFTATGSNLIGEINVSTETLVGDVKAADTNAVAITLGPDGNEWFTSGQGTPAWMGAVVLNPNDLGTQVVVTTQPPDVGVEETVFEGFTYGFGLVVSVENSAGQIDPFVQQGTITIAIDNNPGGGALGGTATIDLSKVPLPVADGHGRLRRPDDQLARPGLYAPGDLQPRLECAGDQRLHRDGARHAIDRDGPAAELRWRRDPLRPDHRRRGLERLRRAQLRRRGLAVHRGESARQRRPERHQPARRPLRHRGLQRPLDRPGGRRLYAPGHRRLQPAPGRCAADGHHNQALHRDRRPGRAVAVRHQGRAARDGDRGPELRVRRTHRRQRRRRVRQHRYHL